MKSSKTNHILIPVDTLHPTFMSLRTLTLNLRSCCQTTNKKFILNVWVSLWWINYYEKREMENERLKTTGMFCLLSGLSVLQPTIGQYCPVCACVCAVAGVRYELVQLGLINEERYPAALCFFLLKKAKCWSLYKTWCRFVTGFYSDLVFDSLLHNFLTLSEINCISVDGV